MSDFDPDQFMSSTIDQPLETERKLCPAGEYKATIDDFTREAFQAIGFTYKKGPRAGEEGTFTKFNVPFVIDDAKVQSTLGMDKVVVYQSITLDLDDSNQLQWGVNKNIDLGKLRKAVGQNNSGPWSPGNLRGAGPVIVKVVHRSGKRQDGSEWKNAEVERVAPIT